MNSKISQYKILKFFRAYVDFFNTDLEAAIIEERDFRIIELFRQTMMYLMDPKFRVADIKKLTNDIKNILNEEKKYFNKILLYQEHDTAFYEPIDKFNYISSSCVEFIEAYAIVSESFNSGDKSYEYRIFQDLLVEFNNALAHLLIALCTNEKSGKEAKDLIQSNLDKSCAHFYRGALDSYKEVTKLNQLKVRRDITKYPILGDVTLEDYYLSVRTLEGQNIGGKVNNKNTILNSYKTMATVLINDFSS